MQTIEAYNEPLNDKSTTLRPLSSTIKMCVVKGVTIQSWQAIIQNATHLHNAKPSGRMAVKEEKQKKRGRKEKMMANKHKFENNVIELIY